jgi:hypothetical protein
MALLALTIGFAIDHLKFDGRITAAAQQVASHILAHFR